MTLSGSDVEAFVASVRERSAGIDSVRAVELRVVEPFLECLGWDVRGPSVDPQAGVAGGRVSYLLSVEGSPAIAVQSAAPGADLKSEYVPAVVGILERGPIDWAVVTDGQRYVLLASSEGEVHSQRHRLSELPDAVASLQHYTRDAAEHRAERAGSERSAALRRLADRRSAAVDAVTESLVSIAGDPIEDDARAAAAELVDGLLDSVSDAPGGPSGASASAADPESAQFADDGGDVERADSEPSRNESRGGESIDGEPSGGERSGGESSRGENGADPARSSGSTPPDPSRQPSPTAPGASSQSASSARPTGQSRSDDGERSHGGRPHRDERSGEVPASARGASDDPEPSSGPLAPTARAPDDGEYVVRFFGGNASVGAVGTDNPAGTLVGAVRYLLENQGLASSVTLPWSVQADRAVIAATPEHPDGSAMTYYESIEDRWYVWTGGDDDRIRTAIEELADVAGLRVMFQGDW